MASLPAVAIPGQALSSTNTHRAGPGTHVFKDKIFASISGALSIIPNSNNPRTPILIISRDPATHDSKSLRSSTLPAVGSKVLCRVTRVQQRQVIASILVIEPSDNFTSFDQATYSAATNEDLQFQAIMRKEDVRAYEKDKIVLNDMFRAGDIICANVISLGDERNYYVSTAGNEYGVVVATSEDGNAMIPASWKEMRDVVSGVGEARKVAKPI